ncbi:Chitin synthase, class 5 [Stygiomarasmius scandens]|uniref:Chitin synthase, class 5 n=1 Tax=Marasmiellus scandens TaxID=2682957 RepID=A0ABR1ILW8_9AGAR
MSTVTLTAAYIVNLVLVAGEHNAISTISLIMLTAIYCLQVLLFIMRWDMIGWMIFYILAIPIFSFLLPLLLVLENGQLFLGSDA